jgi:ATP-dependent DNA helicase DinG
VKKVDSKSVFGENGSLKKINPAFISRPSQLEMAQAIEEAIKKKEHLIVEAGTGTGKTFAYLVPALLKGGKVLVSTGTKTLQDQLFHKDLPAMKKVLGKGFSSALLKGRSNYLCLYRLKYHAPTQSFASKKILHDLTLVNEWANSTRKGDTAELDEVPEDSAIWPVVTSTNDNCLGTECPLFKDCHVVKARRAALKADIVVINHHLFFADALLKEEGYSELLPNANMVVFDEAHQLMETATLFFSERVSSRQISLFCSDTKKEHEQSVNDSAQLVTALDKVEFYLRQLKELLGRTGSRELWQKVAAKPQVRTVLESVNEYLALSVTYLAALAQRSPGLKHCHERGAVLLKSLNDLVVKESAAQYVHWYEVHNKNFSIYLTPISIADPFSALVKQDNKVCLFTSATLTANQNFDYLKAQLGLDNVKHLLLETPFDLGKQTLLYIPRNLPDIKAPTIAAKMSAACLPVIKKNPGGTFFLFTSYSMMHAVFEELKDSGLTLWVQGTMSKRALLEKFTQHEGSVLLGTASFWEGIDLPGDALSCVIIDKLPFASPGEPIVKARIEAMRGQGLDPFQAYQLPEAAISLKQGIGRLIRSVNDSGVLIVCDLRLIARQYGAVFLNSLSGIPLTRDLDRALSFYDEENNSWDQHSQ